MAYTFGSLVFTPAIKALQERYGSRRAYSKRDTPSPSHPGIGPAEAEFLAEADSFYIATVGATGWPYVQHRGGPSGFLKVIDENTLAFADYRGNKQFISAGNLTTDGRVALILVDYPRQARLKILGRVTTIEGSEMKDWLEKLGGPGEAAAVERIFVIQVEAFDWNCQQHITPRFTAEQIRNVLGPIEERLHQADEENQKLRAQVERLSSQR